MPRIAPKWELGMQELEMQELTFDELDRVGGGLLWLIAAGIYGAQHGCYDNINAAGAGAWG